MASARTNRTPKIRAAFIEELSRRGNVSDACTAAGIARTTAYEWRAADATFAAEWDAALDVAADRMEREAFRRGVEGVEEPVYQGGAEVGTITKYSDTLLIFLMKAARPEKYRERSDVKHSGSISTDQARAMSDDELEAELKRRGLA